MACWHTVVPGRSPGVSCPIPRCAGPGLTARRRPLLALGNALLDELDGRRLLVYVEPTSGIPMALYTQATECAWQGDALHLDTGEAVRQGRLLSAQGKPQTAARPMQVFTRWYGFAYTFPGCEIYEG